MYNYRGYVYGMLTSHICSNYCKYQYIYYTLSANRYTWSNRINVRRIHLKKKNNNKHTERKKLLTNLNMVVHFDGLRKSQRTWHYDKWSNSYALCTYIAAYTCLGFPNRLIVYIMLQRITIGILTVVFRGYAIIISLTYNNIVDWQKKRHKKIEWKQNMENKCWRIVLKSTNHRI